MSTDNFTICSCVSILDDTLTLVYFSETGHSLVWLQCISQFLELLFQILEQFDHIAYLNKIKVDSEEEHHWE